MATTPPVRQRKTTSASLVAQAKASETPTSEYKNWTVRIPTDLAERVWGVCEAVGDDEDLRSAVAYTVRAFELLADELEAKHNNGQPYHRATSPFRPGGHRSYTRK